MAAVIDDPLITRMVIRRQPPLHESSRRLWLLHPGLPAGLRPGCDVGRPQGAVGGRCSRHSSTDRPRRDVHGAAAATWRSTSAAAQQLAATLTWVIGRVVVLFVPEGRPGTRV